MKRTITVVGTGSVTAAPDIATVNVGVQVQAANAQDALRRANELATAVLDAVRGVGVADTDLRTNGPHLWPNDRGYQCGNDITVVVRDVSTTGSVIDVAAGAGGAGFTISGVSFGVAEPVASADRGEAGGDGERPRCRDRVGVRGRRDGRRGRDHRRRRGERAASPDDDGGDAQCARRRRRSRRGSKRSRSTSPSPTDSSTRHRRGVTWFHPPAYRPSATPTATSR